MIERQILYAFAVAMIQIHKLICRCDMTDDVELVDRFLFCDLVSQHHACEGSSVAGDFCPFSRRGQVFLRLFFFNQYGHKSIMSGDANAVNLPKSSTPSMRSHSTLPLQGTIAGQSFYGVVATELGDGR